MFLPVAFKGLHHHQDTPMPTVGFPGLEEELEQTGRRHPHSRDWIDDTRDKAGIDKHPSTGLIWIG